MPVLALLRLCSIYGIAPTLAGPTENEMDRHYYCRLLLSEIPAWTWAELCFLFVVLGRSLVLHFHSAPHDVLYVGTNSLLFAWRTRFDVARKKKNDMHDRQRTAKNQTTV